MHLFLRSFQRVSRDESGQMLILFAILLPVLFGFAAIAIDIGILRYQKEQLQSAADAAVISSTLEASYCGGYVCPLMEQAAQQAMAENGYSNVTIITDQCSGATSASSTGVTLYLNNPPCALGSTDPNSGKANSIEAIASKPEPTYFGRLFGFGHIKVAARAEGSVGSSPYCIYVSTVPSGTTSPDNQNAVLVNSGGHLTASCGLMDGSIDSSTAFVADSGAHVDTTQNTVAGGDSLNGGGNSVHVNPAPSTNALALPDPLAFMTPPSNPYSSCVSYTNGSPPSPLPPGCYSGLTLNGGEKVQLSSGLYYFTGPVILDSGSSLTGTGVTFYVTGNGSLTANSGSRLNISAPAGTSDQTGLTDSSSANALYNVVYYQNPTDTNKIIYDSGNKSGLQGIFYAAGAEMYSNSGANTAAYTILDVKTLYLDSGAKLNMGSDYSAQPDGVSPIKGVTAILSE